jgi:E-phenylitaconyl-CoA hydratase
MDARVSGGSQPGCQSNDHTGVRIERQEAVGLLVIDRPHARNSLTLSAHAELIRLWDILQNDPEIRAVVITGAEDSHAPPEKQSFCAGADVREIGAGAAVGASIPSVAAVRGQTPVIAAINGYCIGAGLGFALAAELRIASPTATFGFPELRMGTIPGNGSIRQAMLELPRAIVMELLLVPGRMSASRAFELGLVNLIVSHDQVLPTAMSWAREISSLPSSALHAAMLLASTGPTADPAVAAEAERVALHRLNESPPTDVL